ncbi:hypothetical protein [Flagellimonas algicola]|uniref:Uncharacterized protein n=1 Tax=Flagellimonas algicola TaxID=2583815 RepID=A0ABY2WNK1_9FLAO|nr:hypothetical protein [Allomuricauda algicola]TMU56468.1 hypothetical protein FGG15_02715 [Allomuricauda algicola]
MCTKNIEDLNQVVCALERRYKGEKIEVEPIMLVSEELLTMTEAVPGTFFYGILTVGADTVCDIELADGNQMNIAANSQIIEFIATFQIDGNSEGAAFFRGWEIKVPNQSTGYMTV